MIGIEGLAAAMIKGLTSFLIGAVFSGTSVNIEGAPDWFYEKDKRVCEYVAKEGGYSSVEKAKNSAQKKLDTRITKILESVAYDNFGDKTNKKEQEFILTILNDEKQPIFVSNNTIYPKIAYDKDINTAFVKACVDNQKLLDYEKKRIKKIKNKLSHYRADEAFEELEKEDDNF